MLHPGWGVLAWAAAGVVLEVLAPRSSGRVAARCGELGEQIAGELGWDVVAKEVMADHVHVLVRVGATDVPASVVRVFKGRTAWVLRAGFGCLWWFAKVLWSPSCFAASVG